jgi:hypothetical protein
MSYLGVRKVGREAWGGRYLWLSHWRKPEEGLLKPQSWDHPGEAGTTEKVQRLPICCLKQRTGRNTLSSKKEAKSNMLVFRANMALISPH